MRQSRQQVPRRWQSTTSLRNQTISRSTPGPPPADMAAFVGLLRRDLRLSFRQGGDVGLVLGFFVLVVVLFPFGVGPEPEALRRVGAGIVWVAALLSAVLSLDRLFAVDHADGGLDLMVLSALPLEM